MKNSNTVIQSSSLNQEKLNILLQSNLKTYKTNDELQLLTQKIIQSIQKNNFSTFKKLNYQNTKNQNLLTILETIIQNSYIPRDQYLSFLFFDQKIHLSMNQLTFALSLSPMDINILHFFHTNWKKIQSCITDQNNSLLDFQKEIVFLNIKHDNIDIISKIYNSKMYNILYDSLDKSIQQEAEKSFCFFLDQIDMIADDNKNKGHIQYQISQKKVQELLSSFFMRAERNIQKHHLQQMFTYLIEEKKYVEKNPDLKNILISYRFPKLGQLFSIYESKNLLTKELNVDDSSAFKKKIKI